MPPLEGLHPGDLRWNWTKVSALCILGIAAASVHMQKHFLDKAEYREGTPIGNFASWAAPIIASGSLGNIALSYLYGEQPLHGRWQLDEVIALVVLISGALLRFWAQSCLKELFTYQVGIRQGHRLIQSGPYAVLRHPSYTGSILIVAGLTYLTAPHSKMLWAVPVVACTAMLGVRMLDEEKVLLHAFGDQCKDYFKRTWRLIPFVF